MQIIRTSVITFGIDIIIMNATLQIVLVKICLHLTQQWAKLNQTLGNNLPNNSSKKCELGKFYATLVKCCPII